MRQRGLRQRESSIESVASRESSCERVA
jgi:hypothetical protein